MQALVFRTDLPRIAAALLYKKITKKIALFPGKPLALLHVEEPQIQDDHYVKIKTRLCGICGTDLHILGIELSLKSSVLALSGAKTKAPMFLGHEVVGEVVAIGKKVTKVHVGQRVTLADEISCASLNEELCCFCKEGFSILCLRRNERSAYKGACGGWSDYFIRHENQLIPVPDSISDDVAVLLEPLACSLHAVFRKSPKEGGKVLVIGGGMIGLGVVSAIRALNIKDIDITILARHPFQQERALALGADRAVPAGDIYNNLARILNTQILGKNGNRILHSGFDVVYDCVGNSSTFNDSLRWVRPRGSIILVGINMIPDKVDGSPIWLRELDVVGVHGYAHDFWEGEKLHTVERCIRWISSGRLNAAGLLTHRFPLSQYREALQTTTSHQTMNSSRAEAKKAIKVAFDFHNEKG